MSRPIFFDTGTPGGSTDLQGAYDNGAAGPTQTIIFSAANGGIDIDGTGADGAFSVVLGGATVAGAITLTSGSGPTVGDAGAQIRVTSGDGAPGDAATNGGDAGDITIQTGGGGNPNTPGTGDGGLAGDLYLLTGNGGIGSSGGSAGTGGGINITCGAGGADLGANAGDGGVLALQAGLGGAGTSVNIGGSGGQVSVAAGAGGANAAGAGGPGGGVVIDAGDGGAGATDGGFGGLVSITAGAGTNAGGATGTGGGGGSVSLAAGAGKNGTAGGAAGSGGGVSVVGGASGVNFGGGGNVGGAVAISAGQGSGGNAANAASAGGVATLSGGVGGSGTAAVLGATGGAATVAAGTGGLSGGAGGGAGGDVNLTGGTGGAAAAVGGNVIATVGNNGAGVATGIVSCLAATNLTATTYDLLRLDATSSGSTTISFGAALIYRLQNSTPAQVIASRVSTIWTDATAASEDASYNIFLITAGALSTTVPVVSWTGVTGETLTIDDAATNTTTDLLTLTHTTSGTAAASFGTGIVVNMESAGGTTRSAARNSTTWSVATNAAESAQWNLFLMTGGALSTTVPTLAASGVTGQTTVVNDAATATTTDVFNLTHTTSGTAATSFGVGMTYNLENAAGTSVLVARESVVYLDATNASEDVEFRFFAITAGTVPTTATWSLNGASGGTTFITDAATATVTDLMTLDHRSSGTAAAGYGTGILLRGQDASGTAGGDDMIRLAASWAIATSGSERSQFIIQGRTTGGALTTLATFLGNGTLTTLSDVIGPAAATFKCTPGSAGSTTIASGASFVNVIFKGLANGSSQAGASWTLPAMTAQATTVESSQWIVTGQTKTWANGAITTNRETVWTPGTMAFASGTQIVTNAVAFEISNALAAGTSAQFTNSVILNVGGASSIGATAAGMTYSAVAVPAHTVTVTGTTQVTSRGFAALSLGIVTITDASAVTVDTSATLYIAGAPAQAGSVTLTQGYSIWVDDGGVRFDQFIEGFEMTAPAAPAANGYRMFSQDNGAGKTQLMVIFNTGVAQQIAIQP